MTTLQDLLDPQLDRSFKGFPHNSPPVRRSDMAKQGWNVLKGDLPLPLAVVKQSAMATTSAGCSALPKARAWTWRRTARPPCRRNCSSASSTKAPGA
jgi:hypothetical protein